MVKPTRFLLHWLTMMISANGISWLIINFSEAFTYKGGLLAQALILVVCGYIHFPNWNNFPEPIDLVIWCILSAASLWVTPIIHFHSETITNVSMMASTTVFILSLCFLSVTRAVVAIYRNPYSAPWMIFCLIILLAMLPVWVSPWVDSANLQIWQLNVLIWICPLSYIASVIEFDFLRSDWFYQHTPYGMLRYDYPDGLIFSFVLLGVAVVLLTIKPHRSSARKHGLECP